MKPLRIGILGAASIARPFTRDVASSPQVRVVAVASRTAGTAAAFAAATGIGRHHACYEDLLADRELDAVYLPLPNSLHAEWAIRAAEAGKHVLCEKPLALSAAEAAAMFAAARRHGMMLLEAYPYWFQPQTGDLVSLLQAGAIGSVRTMQASFGFTVGDRATNIRLKPELGGGALLDAGSYCLSLIRLVMGSAPARVRAEASWADPAMGASGVDIETVGTLSWDDGRRAQFSCSMQAGYHRKAQIVGSDGVIETDFLNHTAEPGVVHPHGFQPSRLRIRRGIPNTLPLDDVHSPAGSGFRFEAEAFARVVASGDTAAIDRAAAASLDIAATLEALARSVRSGLSEPVVPARC